jgi:putative endonuclease
MMAVSSQRSLAESAGRRAERLAALSLQLKGYVILDRRVKTGRGEVDLIARRKDVLAFVEVKMRRHHTDPAEILAPRQMQRIVNGATGWAAARSWTRDCVWRYDLIMVTPWRWPHHIRDAWQPQNDPALAGRNARHNIRPQQQRRK